MERVEAAPIGLQVDVDAVSSFVVENPVLVAGFVLATLVAVGLGVVVLRRFTRTRGERLRRLIGRHESVSVLMHPNPDPDAMAAALGAKQLADSVGTDATLHYPGQIRHQENRAFETVLDLSFDRIETADDLDGDQVVLVDHNEPRGFSGAERIDPIAVIDHHPGGGDGSQFTDVRTDTGACASIFAEYFEEMGWEPADPSETDAGDSDAVVDPTVATGLLYGIQSDTKQLTEGCSAMEFDAASYLYPGIDQDQLTRIANPEVDAEVLEIKAAAITQRDVRNAFAISDVGTVSNVDAIPQAADELLRLEGVTAVVVFGDREETIHLSGRSRDDRVHMGKTLDAVVGELPMASAGGHARMGGGQISIEHMQGLGPSDGMDRKQLVERLFEAMSGDV